MLQDMALKTTWVKITSAKPFLTVPIIIKVAHKHVSAKFQPTGLILHYVRTYEMLF